MMIIKAVDLPTENEELQLIYCEDHFFGVCLWSYLVTC